MNAFSPTRPNTLGLFEKRFAGDDCLLDLARRRFNQARMGAEIHAVTPEQLKWLLTLRPWPEAPAVVHLPREYDLLAEETQKRIAELARAGAGQVLGLVVHDQKAVIERKGQYLDAIHRLNVQLEQISRSPLLFIEYAIGLAPNEFVGLFSNTSDLERIAPCIDIGHVGIQAVRSAYAKTHPGHDVCALKAQGPELPHSISDVEDAVAAGVQVVLEVVSDIARLNKPVHFHLHDGHPLSSFSPYGVADHLSFFSEIPLNFEHRGKRSLPLMFGPRGLETIVKQALTRMNPAQVSFTLEIHPTGDRMPLGDASALFAHWTDKTNAERMSHWLSVLAQNHGLLRQAIDRQLVKPRPTC